MNSYQKRIIAAVAVGIAMVTAVYIALDKDAVVSTAYGSLVLAALIGGASLWQLTKCTGKDYVTAAAFPLALKGYLAATVLMAVVFVALDLTGAWVIPVIWYLVLQVIVIGLTVWKLLAIGAAKDAIDQVGAAVQATVSNWKLRQADAEALLQTAPVELRRDITAVRDAIRYADPMSRPEVAAQEQEIAEALAQLKDLAKDEKIPEAKALCTRIQDVIKGRANRLKILK